MCGLCVQMRMYGGRYSLHGVVLRMPCVVIYTQVMCGCIGGMGGLLLYAGVFTYERV